MADNDGRTERILEHSRALGGDLRQLRDELSGAAQELKSRMDFSRSIQEHPLRSVAIAVGVGYVLGGGLFSPMTRRLLGVGTRAMLLPILRSQVLAMIEGQQLRQGGSQGGTLQ